MAAVGTTGACERQVTDSVDAYLAGVLSVIHPLRPRRLSLEEADGAVLAGDVAGRAEVLLAAGTRLGPAQLGLLAAAGQDTVQARPRPRVAVLSTGNELADPGTAVTAGQVWESNSLMLAAAARLAGCVARRRPVARDDANEVLTAVTEAIADADLLVTSGGISMGGEHDSVKAALQDLGTVSFRKVAMRPGTPQGFGVLGPAHTPVLTLPGNPVSAYVSFCLFVLPAVRALQGCAAGDDPRATPAVLTAPVRSAAGKRTFIGAVHEPEAGLVTPLSERSTHNLAVLARANALIIVPDETTALAAGDPVDVMRLPCDPRAGPEPAAVTGVHSSMALTSRASTAST